MFTFLICLTFLFPKFVSNFFPVVLTPADLVPKISPSGFFVTDEDEEELSILVVG